MFRRVAQILVPFSLVLAGCGRGGGEAQPGGQPSSVEGTAVAADGQDLAPVLAELTQTVRKYSAEQRRVPESLNELVSAGYLKQIPAAPAGKAFYIDARTLEVDVK